VVSFAPRANQNRATSLNQLGIIETRGDADWFSDSNGDGNLSLSTNHACQAWINQGFGNFSSSLLAGRSPNLDIAASPYYGTNGTPIPRSNPLDRLPTSFHLNLSAGRGQQGIQGGSPGSGD
jgi:hypothetical protein